MTIEQRDPPTIINIQMLPSPESLSLTNAKRLAEIMEQTHVEVLGTYPDSALGQSGTGFIRLTSLSRSRKWSNDAYRWCVGSAGFAVHDGNHSFLAHAITHGSSWNGEEARLRDYRGRIQCMLDIAGAAHRSDVVIFGGSNPSGRQHNYSAEIRKRMAEIVLEESHGDVRPLVIPPLEQDTMKSPIPKRVLIDTKRGQLYYFETGPKQVLQDRSYRFSDMHS